MKHVLHRAGPPVLKDLASENSIGRVLWGFIVFAVLGTGVTLVVITRELMIAAVTLALVAYLTVALNARVRTGKKEDLGEHPRHRSSRNRISHGTFEKTPQGSYLNVPWDII